MKNSHTLSLISEAFEKAQKFNYERYTSEIENISQNIPNVRSSRQKHKVNQILERIGLHLMYKSVFEELENNSYSKMGKWSSVGTFQLALKNPEKFDEVYNLFTDADSKSTFDWFIKYRLEYAFLGELAGEVFPPKITKAKFLKGMNSLKIDSHRLMGIQNLRFKSSVLETAQSWVFEQYNLDGKCEVSRGDYIIDGEAFKGETSFWFLSKGAGKVYAFEPDHYNFSILCKNIIRNKVEDKIIPVQKILSNRTGTFSLYATSSAGSVALTEGNETVEGITLDSFVEKEGLQKLDFIKLDVEGAELEVLEGAVETIKKFKSKMAISAYHKPEDIITISEFILQFLPNAKFYLSHKNWGWSDTVLFVNPRVIQV
jgi:FkbM family methyltransferase